jgi:hypothetical protein
MADGASRRERWSDPQDAHDTLGALAADARTDRETALRALHVVEYALMAPAPRRHRTWLHRVAVAVDALHAALVQQLPTPDGGINLLDEIALSQPAFIARIERLQQELRDLTIAVESLREQIEPDPAIEIDPAAIRDRLAVVATRFRRHQASEADLVHEATGRDVDAS